MEPFKIVKTEYFEEVDWTTVARERRKSRRIKVVTRTEEWTGSNKDPVVETHFEYL